ncbi:unnamed protein product [Leptidea sinapis]|uniref:Peptidyl-prolyl cis-trans isomerase n=1 Tax=Leptidea sinapis TaxID=189913 RepID=A0A5E4QVD0_9NEOP|nr:unnamed protein product [Leptidea sinapis]
MNLHLFRIYSIVALLNLFTYINAREFRVTDKVFLDFQIEDKALGRVVIGLFGDLAPKAVKNFKVLATKGIKGKSYKGTCINRILKRFIVQGGDVVSDDGSGSISIYGKYFDDENLDTQHTLAGFVSMANKEHTPIDVDDRPTKRVYISDCGLLETDPFYITDDPYDLWSWLRAAGVPLTMSFSILGFFHWLITKMNI